MKVTDKELSMRPLLKEKLDLMIHRMEAKGYDNAIIMDGKEGTGKSTLAAQLCYYVSHETGRDFNVDNIYFRVRNLLKAMQSTSKGIFMLDEAELDLLSESRGKLQRYFMQMLMAARKKNHFIIAIIPKVKKLKSYVVERAIALIRVYSPDKVSRGYYAYYKEEDKNRMYEKWKRSRRMEYKKFYTFPGTFSDRFSDIIDEEKYDKKKDEAIASIGKSDKVGRAKKKLVEIQYRLYWMGKKNWEGLNITKIANKLNFAFKNVSKWQHLPDKYPFLKEIDV